jgi:hypothetical protein
MKKTSLNEKIKAGVPEVLPSPTEQPKIVVTSITFDKNGNLYGIGNGILHTFNFDTKKWAQV